MIHVPDVLVHDEVDVSLAVSQVCVLEAVPLVRQHLQRLAQQLDLAGPDADLAGLCHEDLARDADDVARVVGLEDVVLVLADVVARHEDLDTALLVLHVHKRDLAHAAERHDTAGDSDLLVFHRLEVVLDVFRPRGHVKGLLKVRVPAHLTELFEFLSLYLSLFAYLLFGELALLDRRLRLVLIIVCHYLLTSTTLYLAMPSGTANSTLSPAFSPRRCDPTSEAFDSLPFSGSASVVPTILYVLFSFVMRS